MQSRSSVSPANIARPRIAAVAAAVVSAAAVVAVAVPTSSLAAATAPPPSATSPASLAVPPLPLAARGGGFRSRPRISPSRPLSRNRPVVRRNPNTGRALRSFSRSLMRALGIAFLLSLLFGIGPGGSPLGLLVLLGIIALVVVARRRRRQYGYR